MLNSFLSLNTLSGNLFNQQLNQDIIANNLANTYLDSNGYLMNSRQRLDLMEASPLFFGSGPAGLMAVGQGAVVQQITRLRDSFLDTQIQQESSIVGLNEIQNGILNQINGVINASSGTTLDAALTTFANDWTALSANPSDVGLRSAVVNDGVAFANLARNQYNGLQNIQKQIDQQVNLTVQDINQILQQIADINHQLLNTQGANVNSLLDARDYALDRLSRLVNIQVNIGAKGTADVFLGGSSVALVDAAGASVLMTDVMNGHNPGLTDIKIQTSEGSISYQDIYSWITGGQLAGELQARDVTLEYYKTQIDQVATSVMNVTNIFHSAGYAANGATTGVAFFTGTGAADINVNAALVTDSTRALLATSSVPFTAPAVGNGQIAQFIGNIRNLLANNYVQSRPGISAGVVDPTQPINTQPLSTIPFAAGSFTVNGVAVNWNNTQSIDTILAAINAADPNVQAVFNQTTRTFYMLSNNPINIVNTAGNFTLWGNISNVLVSTIRMNNGFAPTDPNVVYGFPNPANSGLNSLPNSAVPLPNGTGNLQAFRVTPSLGGSFTLDGVTINWQNTGASAPNNPPGAIPGADINENLFYIVNNLINLTPFPGTTITGVFNTGSQTLTLFSQNQPRPITIVDNTGNFTVFTGLNGNTPVGNLSSGVLGNISSNLSSQKMVLDQSQAALTQLNNAQANVGAVALNSGDPGEPIQAEQEAAVKSLIAFNASLEVLQVIDQMYADLVSVVGGSPPSGFFQQRA